MYIKIFTAENGYIFPQPDGETSVRIEDAIGRFIVKLKDFKIIQSQSGENSVWLTITIIY